MKSHEEFLEEVEEVSREPTIKEKTEDAFCEVDDA